MEARILALWFLMAAAAALSAPLGAKGATETYALPDEKFHSALGREHVVEFRGVFRTEFATPVQARAVDRTRYFANRIRPNFAFLYGPLTNRKLGSPQRGANIEVDWDGAYVGERGFVELPYRYRATWILRRELREGTSFEIPAPYDSARLQTAAWRSCTDRDPEHQTLGFFWYFWDPARSGCDHALGAHYQMVNVGVGRMTPNTENTAPDYARLLESTGAPNTLRLTFAFGYYEEPGAPDPERDPDIGIAEYRKFVGWVRQSLGGRLAESLILQSEYAGAPNPGLVIGRRWQGTLAGAAVTVNVVAAAGVDQMLLFAKSFAHDHDGVFAWMGHSRVGSGFDAAQFQRIVAASPGYYSITPNYQLVYWGGCNSYSYYTLPFFDIKAAAAGGADPRGTLGLDLLVNGIPSYFAVNAISAFTVFKATIRWQDRTTYQSIVREFEVNASRMGTYVLAAVLGDEDNPPP